MRLIKISFILISIFTHLNLSAQNEYKSAQELIKKNKIKETFTYEHDLKTGDSLLTNQEVYDRNGNVQKNIRFDENGIEYMFVYEYQNNLRIKQTIYNKNGDLFSILTYSYDEKENQIEFKQFNLDGVILNIQKRKYNNLNQNTEFFKKKPNEDTLFLLHKYYYREDNTYSKIETFNENTELVSESKFIYDEDGNLITVYDIENGLKMGLHSYIYDKKNLLRSSKHQYKSYELLNGKPQLVVLNKKFKYEYDNENNIVEKNIFKDDKLSGKETYLLKKFDL